MTSNSQNLNINPKKYAKRSERTECNHVIFSIPDIYFTKKNHNDNIISYQDTINHDVSIPPYTYNINESRNELPKFQIGLLLFNGDSSNAKLSVVNQRWYCN